MCDQHRSPFPARGCDRASDTSRFGNTASSLDSGAINGYALAFARRFGLLRGRAPDHCELDIEGWTCAADMVSWSEPGRGERSSNRSVGPRRLDNRLYRCVDRAPRTDLFGGGAIL